MLISRFLLCLVEREARVGEIRQNERHGEESKVIHSW